MHHVTDERPSSVDALLARYGPDIRAFVGHLLAGSGDADDVAQETMLRVARADERITGSPWPYIATVARRCVADARGREDVIDLTDDAEVFGTVDPFAEADEAERVMEALHAALSALSPTQRDVLLDYTLNGVDDDELAARHGMAASSVRSMVSRARSVTRERMGQLLRGGLSVLGWRRRERLRERLAAWSTSVLPVVEQVTAGLVAVAVVVVMASAGTARPVVRASATHAEPSSAPAVVAVPPSAARTVAMGVPSGHPRTGPTATENSRTRVVAVTPDPTRVVPLPPDENGARERGSPCPLSWTSIEGFCRAAEQKSEEISPPLQQIEILPVSVGDGGTNR